MPDRILHEIVTVQNADPSRGRRHTVHTLDLDIAPFVDGRDDLLTDELMDLLDVGQPL